MCLGRKTSLRSRLQAEGLWDLGFEVWVHFVFPGVSSPWMGTVSLKRKPPLWSLKCSLGVFFRAPRKKSTPWELNGEGISGTRRVSAVLPLSTFGLGDGCTSSKAQRVGSCPVSLPTHGLPLLGTETPEAEWTFELT